MHLCLTFPEPYLLRVCGFQHTASSVSYIEMTHLSAPSSDNRRSSFDEIKPTFSAIYCGHDIATLFSGETLQTTLAC